MRKQILIICCVLVTCAVLVTSAVPAQEEEAAVFARDNKRVWLEQHGYKVIVVTAPAVERDVEKVLDALASRL